MTSSLMYVLPQGRALCRMQQSVLHNSPRVRGHNYTAKEIVCYLIAEHSQAPHNEVTSPRIHPLVAHPHLRVASC